MTKPKPGRPAFEITEQVCKKVETLAAQGLSKREVALCLGIHVSTYCEKQAEYPEFSEAYDRGASKGVAQVANALYQKAVGGDVTAQKHYLNNRGEGWSERQSNEHTGLNGGPIQITEVARTIVDPKHTDS
jgi:hypothetical protein